MSKQKTFHVVNIKDLRATLALSVKKYANQLATIFASEEGQPLGQRTYKELSQDVASFATGYLELAGKKSSTDKVAIIAENRYEWIVSYLGVVNSGRIIVPIDKELGATEIANLLERCKAKTVIFSNSTAAKIAALKELEPAVNNWISLDAPTNEHSINWWDLLADGADMLAEGDTAFAEQEIDPDQLCTLIFTSGTTGKPKGVMLTHRCLTADIMGFCSLLEFNNERVLSVLPLNHSFEAMCGFLCQIYRGSTIYYLPGGIRNLAANLQIAKPTLMFAVPLIVEGSYKRALADLPADTKKSLIKTTVKKYWGGKLERIVVGGAPMSPDMIARYDELGIPVLHGAGLTENSPVIAVNPMDNRVDSSIGLPLPNIKVMIDDVKGDGTGEILVQGETVMLGYYKDKALTEKTIVDGWLHTGDIGFIDQTGHVHITGRQKNIILGKNGRNIYPEELEQALGTLDVIDESLVYGEIKNDDVIVTALIVPDKKTLLERLNGNYTDSEAEKIIKQAVTGLNKTLAKHKQIKQVRLGEALPRTSSGKVKRS